MTGNPVLDHALEYARRSWPVFPCQPGRKIPATTHGYLDATTDTGQITAWFTRHPDRNLAIATGLPGPDVLDIDVHPSGSGYPALSKLARAGLTQSATAWIRTPGGGAHGYFAGSRQRNGHLAGQHLDFRSAGGYVLAPPSIIDGRPYAVASLPGDRGGLDWNGAVALLQPEQTARPPVSGRSAERDIGKLAAWVASLPEGNRNAGLYWAANRALDDGHDDLLGQLTDAARTAGLPDAEIRATLNSARRTARRPPEPQAETAS